MELPEGEAAAVLAANGRALSVTLTFGILAELYRCSGTIDWSANEAFTPQDPKEPLAFSPSDTCRIPRHEAKPITHYCCDQSVL